jgi:uncharacterized lipoprotein YajG
MNRSILTIALGLACLAGACAAPKPMQVASAPAAKPVDPGSVKVCVSVDTTGSRLPSEECHTRDEWADLKAKGAQDLPNQSQADNPYGGIKP